MKLIIILSSICWLFSEIHPPDEQITKTFNPAGTIEAIISIGNEDLLLIQLDLKNDSLLMLVRQQLPDLDLFSGPASYHRAITTNHLTQIQSVLSSEFYEIIDDDYQIPNSNRSYWVEVQAGSNANGTMGSVDENNCMCLGGASDCMVIGFNDDWWDPLDYWGESWYSFDPPYYQTLEEIRVTVTGAQCDALPIWSETYMGMRNESGNWSQDYQLSIDYTNNIYVVTDIWNTGFLMPQLGSEDNYAIDKVKLEFFYSCDGPEFSPSNLMASNYENCSFIDVSWELSPDIVTQQKLYRDGELISSFDDMITHFEDWMATPNVEHLYCIEAVNECGVSSQICNPGQLKSAPILDENVIATDGEYNDRILVTWQDSELEDQYKIYRDGLWLGINLADQTSYEDIFIEFGITYDYCIEALNDCGISTWECDSGYSQIPPGDINQDSEINILDIVLIVNVILGETALTDYIEWSADMNNDQLINILDIIQLINIILN